jgi:outer membrane murein-binding lipoprotein Lpp
MKKISIVFISLLGMILLAACGNGQREQKLTAENSSLRKTNKNLKADASSMKVELSAVRKEADLNKANDNQDGSNADTSISFKNKVLTTHKMTVKFDSSKIMTDEDGKKVIMLYVTIANTTGKNLDVDDEWTNFVTANQLTDTSNVDLDSTWLSGKDEKKEDFFTNDLLPGKTVKAAYAYTLENNKTVKLTFSDIYGDDDTAFGSITFPGK